MNPISIKHTLRLCGLAVVMSAAGLLTAHAQTTTLGTRSSLSEPSTAVTSNTNTS